MTACRTASACLRHRDPGARREARPHGTRGSGERRRPRSCACDFAAAPYDTLGVRNVTSRRQATSSARVAVRFDEDRGIAAPRARDRRRACPEGEVRTELSRSRRRIRKGLGYVEGWRGPVLVALECGPGGTIRRCHPHDPSWTNWPVLEHAVIGNIVPDFPLINKSFNLSYSGQDL